MEPLVVEESIKGLFNWLLYHHRYDFFPAAPQLLLDELVWKISSRRQPGLKQAIEHITLILENFPDTLNELQINNVSNAVDYLIQDTDLNTLKEKVASKSHFPIKMEEGPEYRREVSHLALTLYKYFKGSHKSKSKSVTGWRKTFENDPLPEVRQIWDII